MLQCRNGDHPAGHVAARAPNAPARREPGLSGLDTNCASTQGDGNCRPGEDYTEPGPDMQAMAKCDDVACRLAQHRKKFDVTTTYKWV